MADYPSFLSAVDGTKTTTPDMIYADDDFFNDHCLSASLTNARHTRTTNQSSALQQRNHSIHTLLPTLHSAIRLLQHYNHTHNHNHGVESSRAENREEEYNPKDGLSSSPFFSLIDLSSRTTYICDEHSSKAALRSRISATLHGQHHHTQQAIHASPTAWTITFTTRCSGHWEATEIREIKTSEEA